CPAAGCGTSTRRTSTPGRRRCEQALAALLRARSPQRQRGISPIPKPWRRYSRRGEPAASARDFAHSLADAAGSVGRRVLLGDEPFHRIPLLGHDVVDCRLDLFGLPEEARAAPFRPAPAPRTIKPRLLESAGGVSLEVVEHLVRVGLAADDEVDVV